MSADDVVLPGEASRLSGVPVATLTRWARLGLVPVAVTTPHGHRRYFRRDMVALREQMDGLTVTEVAGVFHVDVRTVKKWLDEGILPTAKRTPGGGLRFPREDVEALRGKGGETGASR